MASPERIMGKVVEMNNNTMPFHVLHKVPTGDSLYVRAKHVQIVDRDPEKAVGLFYAAIDAGDRVDSALKDMAIVLKQQNRCEEAILAISCYRSRCSQQSQGSLDNVLLDLYKSCGRLEDQIALLIQKLQLFQNGQAFNGKRTKTARSQGRKFQVSVEQEASRLLGNLGWAYMQQANYSSAEFVYRKAMALEVGNNKICNIGVCLMKQGRFEEAIAVLKGVSYTNKRRGSSESHLKSYQRAQELIMEAYNNSMMKPINHSLADSSSDSNNFMNPNTITDEMEDSTVAYNHKEAISNVEEGKSCAVKYNRNMSSMVAAAWMFACSNSSQRVVNDENYRNYNIIDDGSEQYANGEEEIRSDPCFHQSNTGYEECMSGGASFPTSYFKSQVLQEPSLVLRRLPVFQDLTIPGSAA